jgi:hypothetical protein
MINSPFCERNSIAPSVLSRFISRNKLFVLSHNLIQPSVSAEANNFNFDVADIAI